MHHLLFFVFLLLPLKTDASGDVKSATSELLHYYESFDPAYPMPDFDLFKMGVSGHLKLLQANRLGTKNILTIVDFRRPSSQKRLWVIDLAHKKVLFYTLVAHGRNTGELYAEKFSNVPNSNSSSLGFYVTGDTYSGKHGLSLYLDGQEKGFNERARERAIVIHGADYVSVDFISTHGRLGRSFGCPSVSMAIHEQMINTIKGQTSLLIFYPDKKYLTESTLIRENSLLQQLPTLQTISETAGLR